jgi:effector-binding domain-containing protein
MGKGNIYKISNIDLIRISKLKLLLCTLIPLIVIAAAIAEIPHKEPNFSIRKIEEQVVLYTIRRGSFEDKIGPAIGTLFFMASQKGMKPDFLASYVHLNNPEYSNEQHWITEIRIPVSKEAMKFAGTLGGWTDVKKVPAMEAGVAVKPENPAEYDKVYKSLRNWIIKQGYMPVDNAFEIFLNVGKSENGEQVEAKIMIPVVKLAEFAKAPK